MEDKLIRIGVFYDGNYFFQVSNYYTYGHARRSRIGISGLHDFIKHQVANEESVIAKCVALSMHTISVAD